MWREGAQAGWLTQAMGKGSFHFQYSFQNTKVFHARLKYIQKVKLHPMRSSLFHAICRILVMVAAFPATLCDIVKL